MFRLYTYMFLVAISQGVALGSDRPNIIVLMADDLGWNHIGVEGSHR